MTDVHQMVRERSGGRCEAMVRLSRTWVRCGKTGVEDHHVLTRARGGEILDSVGEIYHHLDLCTHHHRMVDDMGFDSGLLLRGYAFRENGRVIYQGPDEYLTRRYSPIPAGLLQEAVQRPVQVSVVSDEVRGALVDADARGAL